MAAGDLITTNFQVELRELLMGPGTDFPVLSIRGLGVPAPKTQDVGLAHRPGSFGGRDLTGARVVTVSLEIKGTDEEEIGENIADLLAAWLPSQSDIALHLQYPGLGHISMMGRPRGLDENFDPLGWGGIPTALGTFVALDPTITTET